MSDPELLAVCMGVSEEILAERVRQVDIFDDGIDTSVETWLAMLGEEVGEVARAVLDVRRDLGGVGEVRKELVQVAAVCLGWVQAIDMKGGQL